MNLILGAGLTGLSASYHIGHKHCVIIEKNPYPFGLVHSESHNAFTWDKGPHVSFSKSNYVKELFAKSVSGAYDEFEIKAGNYFKGHWIDHPAQSNLYQIPEPLRGQCLQSFLETRKNLPPDFKPADYAEWLETAFGPCFANTFPAAYTRKYWTVDPQKMATSWIGSRVFLPSVDDVVTGSEGPLNQSTYYITKVRYPKHGGYQSFARELAAGADIRLNCAATSIDLIEKKVHYAGEGAFSYERLISTIPLPIFVRLCRQATPEVIAAAEALSCSQGLLISYEVPHPARRPENWLYVYDEDKYATRIHYTEKMTSGNAPEGKCGIQVEVYASRHKLFNAAPKAIAEKVTDELIEMGLIDNILDKRFLRYSLKSLDWANIIFDHQTRPGLSLIYDWLAGYGLKRHGERDLEPTTDWDKQKIRTDMGSIVLAGRFGAWKYYWSDDCVLNGKYL